MNVSIVVPAYNESSNIERLMLSLLEQVTEHAHIVEIFVVASGCTDDTAEIAKRVAKGRPGIFVHVQDKRDGKVAALNAYLRRRDPRASLIVLCSADLLVEPDVVEKIVRYMEEHPTVGMVGTRPVPSNDDRDMVGKMVHVLWELHHRVAEKSPKMGELVAFRASLVEAVSELSVVDEASVEDIIRSKGFELAYLGDAIVTNHGPETLREYFEQRRRIARGHYWLAFAFGYDVATLHPKSFLGTVVDLFMEEPPSRKAALVAAATTEVFARALGFWDARVVGGRHRTWKPLPSTKRHAPAGSKDQGRG